MPDSPQHIKLRMHWRVIVPSSAVPGHPFTVHIVSRDRFENISCSDLEGDLSDDNGTVIRERIHV